MSSTKYYETGMRITHDPKSNAITVNFRGKVAVLNGPFATEAEGVKAGEIYCRERGWKGGPKDPRAGTSMLASGKR